MRKVTISVTLETQWGPMTATREVEVDSPHGIAQAMRELADEMARELDEKESTAYWNS